MKGCIFCKIANGEIQAKIIYEDKEALVFEDANPRRPIHWLIIPKRHIHNLNDLTDTDLAGKLFTLISILAKKHKFDQKGYRAIINTNTHGGQEIDHLHIHVLAGALAGPLVC